MITFNKLLFLATIANLTTEYGKDNSLDCD